MTYRTRKKESRINDAADFVSRRLAELYQSKVYGVFTVRFGLKNGRICTTTEGIERNYIREGPVPKIKNTSGEETEL